MSIPAIGICGWSGSGKTTLILALTAHFLGKGLRVGIVKHDVHGLNLDREGKDSYRFFEAGADVIMRSTTELLIRAHRPGDVDLAAVLRTVAPYYDLILVEGHKSTPLIDKLWVVKDDSELCPTEVPQVLDVLPRGDERASRAIDLIEVWLESRWRMTPLCGAVLIAKNDSVSAMTRLADLLKRHASRLVAIGSNATGIPDIFDAHIAPVPDHSDWHAGVLAALRWAPMTSWLFVSASADVVEASELDRLIAMRRPGVWVAGRADAFRTGQTVQALYCDYRAGALLEARPSLDEMGRWPVTRQV